MASTTLFRGVLFLIFACSVLGIKQRAAKPRYVEQVEVPSAESIPAQIPPPRSCGCEELNRCYNEQLNKNQNLLAECRQLCGSRIFLAPTLEKVVHCYEHYERGKSAAETRRRECLESLGSRQCIPDEKHSSTPETVTINTTEFLQAETRRNNNYKISYPGSINSMNSCIKVCVKNQGVVQFNPDGSLVKTTKTDAADEKQEKPQKNGNGKDYSPCASQLNCQLSPVDKKLGKDAKKLCQFQPGTQEDFDLNLCSCLENALGQNLYCEQQMARSCASPTSTCADAENHKGNEK